MTMEAAAFDELATDRPMSELLLTARPARPARRAKSAAAAGPRGVNYDTLEHAGEPHKGRITEAERELVRDHLDAINDRLATQGLRTIDPGDPEHVARYGLTGLAVGAGRSGRLEDRATGRAGSAGNSAGREPDSGGAVTPRPGLQARYRGQATATAYVSYAGHHMIGI